MAATVDVHVSYDTVAALAAEALLPVTLLWGYLVTLHRQVIMGQF